MPGQLPYVPQLSLYLIDDVGLDGFRYYVLADILNRWQPAGRLFACNMSEIQKLIRDNCAPRFRTILYRRIMFRVAEKLAKALGDDALVTGESLGQVASQDRAPTPGG